MKNWKPDYWWQAVTYFGAAGFIACIAAHYPAAALAMLGILALGIGFWVSHPFQQAVHFDAFNRPIATVSGRTWKASFLGILALTIGQNINFGRKLLVWLNRIWPRSIRPVTTVPRPEIENTSSIGIKNGKSIFPSVECLKFGDRASVNVMLFGV